MRNLSAQIVEIFSSIQGEGPYTGEKMTFVRFGLCTLRCRYCDTPQGMCHKENCQVETHPGSAEFKEIPNPVGISSLCKILESFSDRTISVTGGEPLEQAEFLAEWLTFESQRRRILLETNGIHHNALSRVLPHTHIVSMDLKLPSSSGQRAMWDEHAKFLDLALSAGKETYVKIVVTEDTADCDIQKSIGILTKINKFIPVIIQPVSPTLTFHQTITGERLDSLERLCSAYLPNVKVMSQMHKGMGIL